MSKPSYWELLRHPLWQRKRLEIFDARDWTCELCRASREKTLHVHHGYYDKALKPWQYPDESLHCLCEDCHRQTQAVQAELYRLIALLPAGELRLLKGLVSARLAVCRVPHQMTTNGNPDDEVYGLGLGFNQKPSVFLREIRNGVISYNGPGLDYQVGQLEREAELQP